MDNYIKMSKTVLNLVKNNRLSLNAAVLYSLLCDRLELSVKNGIFDKSGRPFVIFTRAEALQILGVSERTAKKVFDELCESGLITEKRQGNGLANRIYPNETVNLKNFGSRTEKEGVQEPKISRSINTESNNTESNNTEKILSVCPSECARGDTLENILDKIDFSTVLPETEDLLKTVITRMYYSNTVKNGNEMLPRKEIREMLCRLDTDHIIEIQDRLQKDLTEFTNPSGFVMAMLINVITDHDMTNLYSQTIRNRRCRASP